VDGIPERWWKRIVKRAEILAFADSLLALSSSIDLTAATATSAARP
jgi:hypothetical protein